MFLFVQKKFIILKPTAYKSIPKFKSDVGFEQPCLYHVFGLPDANKFMNDPIFLLLICWPNLKQNDMPWMKLLVQSVPS